MPKAEQFEVRLMSREELAPGTLRLTWQRLDGARCAHTTGQWYNFALPSEEGEQMRAFSAFDSVELVATGTLRCVVALHPGGLASERFARAQPGDVLRAEGPFGIFRRHHAWAEADSIWVGTGTGLSPIHALLSELEPGPASGVTVVAGLRTEADAAFWSSALARPGVCFEACLSRASTDWQGRRGYVQAHLDEIVTLGERTHFYLCGNSAMVKELRGWAKSRGLERSRIHTERFD